MKNINLENTISEATINLIDLATALCWNKIERHCEYIMTEIDDNIDIHKRTRIRKNVNDKKTPKSLAGIVGDLNRIYENLYDINLYVYKALPNKTLIEIQYFLKTSHNQEYYNTIKDNEPMIHCRVALPFYIKVPPKSNIPQRKFDVNWELGGIGHEWNTLLGRIKFNIWRLRVVIKTILNKPINANE